MRLYSWYYCLQWRKFFMWVHYMLGVFTGCRFLFWRHKWTSWNEGLESDAADLAQHFYIGSGILADYRWKYARFYVAHQVLLFLRLLHSMAGLPAEGHRQAARQHIGPRMVHALAKKLLFGDTADAWDSCASCALHFACACAHGCALT